MQYFIASFNDNILAIHNPNTVNRFPIWIKITLVWIPNFIVNKLRLTVFTEDQRRHRVPYILTDSCIFE